MWLLLAFISVGFGQEGEPYDRPPYEPVRVFDEKWLHKNPDLSWEEWVKKWPRLRQRFNWFGMGHGLMEDFRVYQRERFLYGDANRDGRAAEKTYAFNDIDEQGICPDQVEGGVLWDSVGFNENGFIDIDGITVIMDRSVDIKGGGMVIRNNGRLIFKDFGEGATDILTLRSKKIQIHSGGELWIGSRSCRYQGKADITLYGNEGDHPVHNVAGYKFIHVASQGVLEMHGKEKLHWTTLDEHIFRNNVAAEELHFRQTRGINLNGEGFGNRLVFHILSAEGDLMNATSVNNGESIAEIKSKIDALDRDEVILFATDFLFELTEEIRDFFVSYGFDAQAFNTLLAEDRTRRFSQIGGVFNKKGQLDFKSISPNAEGKMHNGLQATLGPVDLAGMKSGFQFSVRIDNVWWFSNTGAQTFTSDVDTWMEAGGWDHFPNNFKKTIKQNIYYTGPNPGVAPILSLLDDVSSWEIGDKIVVTASNYDPRETEEFVIVDCEGECSPNQIKVDRAPNNTHWGRIDERTGAEQRANVGLLSRNVRFYGEMDTQNNTCKYARTREQTNADSINKDRNYCDYYIDVNGFDQDFHGAHLIITKGFRNFHASHMEIFHAGQPHVGRYPVHWHFCDYVGHRGGYEDPSFIESLSIHDAFSRFATIHATHEATIKNCVGHNTFGHGYFLEDGYESYNYIIGNLGAQVKPGIILPSERAKQVCGFTNDGLDFSNYNGDDLCQGLAVFWFANIHNYVHDNVAVGGNSGYWLFTHSAYNSNQFDAIPFDPVSGLREWRNNKACCASRGFSIDESIMDEPPSVEFPVAQFSIGNEFGYRFRSMNESHVVQPSSAVDTRPNLWGVKKSNWAELYFNQLNCHHTNEKNWARGASMSVINSQFSDNSRAWINKGTGPVPGAQRTVRNTTFIGFTRNTGHRICKHPNGYSSYDLATVRQCGDTREGPVNLMDERPQGDVMLQRRVYWYKVEDDVYRLMGRDQWWPWQAMSIYDSHIPLWVENVTFIDYPAKDPNGPARHALGAHVSHKHGLVPKSLGMKNIRYINVDRWFQNALVETEETQLNGAALYNRNTYWGDDHGTTSANKIRSITDGEMNTGYTDFDGIWNNGQPSYIFNPAMWNVNTDCFFVSPEDENSHVGPPGIKVCPITTPYASFQMRTYRDAGPDPVTGRKFYIQTLPLVGQEPVMDETKPNRLMGADVTTRGPYYQNLEAFKVHKMWWTGSAPPANLFLQISEAEVNTWYRMSVCVGKGAVANELRTLKFNYGNDLIGQGWPDTDNQGVGSLEELNAQTEDSFWHDTEKGWLHVKLIQAEDRTKGGTFLDRLENGVPSSEWPTLECGDDPGFTDSITGEPLTNIGLGSRWRFSCWRGQHQFEIEMDASSLNGEPVCDDFDVVAEADEPTTTMPTTTATTTTDTTRAPIDFTCGSRIRSKGFQGSDGDLNGLWTFAMNEDGTIKTNDGAPYYKKRDSNIFMWWMWHGSEGHWVVNQTPGQHGGDRIKSVFGDFSCPQNIDAWEGPSSAHPNLQFVHEPCCMDIQWTRGDLEAFFVRTSNMNEEYPIYQTSDIEGKLIAMWWMWHGPEGHWVINETPGSHGNDMLKSTFGDVVCPNEVSGWELGNGDDIIQCVEDITTTPEQSTTPEVTTPEVTTTSDKESCGPRLMLEGFIGSDDDLNGLWTFAMNDDGSVQTNDDYYYYKHKESELFMWWMWHGAVGHWVINQTPGSHGADRMKSSFGDFGCPPDKSEWEGDASGNDFTIKENPCCEEIIWDRDGTGSQAFVRTAQINEEYPIYKTVIDGDNVFMWWMWHATVGHWVINKTPGSHGHDILKSKFGAAWCPNEIAEWEDNNFGEHSMSCTSETTTEPPTTTSEGTTTTADPCPCTDDVNNAINNGLTPFMAKFSQIKHLATGANSIGFAMSQTIHDADLNPGMQSVYDGYLVMRKYASCDASVLEKFADPSVNWYFTDLTCVGCYTTHMGGYYKNDVSNKKKTFTLGFHFNGDLTADTNKQNSVDKYQLFVTGLQALGVTEQQAYDCVAGAKPANMFNTDGSCDYSDCVGEKILIW